MEFGAGASLPGSYETWRRDGSGTRSWAISPCRFLQTNELDPLEARYFVNSMLHRQ